HAPGVFTDDTGIPESGNGLPDVLDEVRFELEWMLKMQAQSGGVNHKVTCAKFPGFVMPEEEKDELLLSPISTCATADFCGVLAFASRVFAPFDSAFATTCLDAAKRAHEYLEQTPFACFYNPSGIETGQYEDGSDADERYFAACALLYATGEPRFHEAARNLASPAFADGLGWEDMGAYGNALYLMANESDTDSALR
ncbi:MAG TPA: glycoside hydrolase family 9 protein, partial [Feifaniaceae bacterium]|nr:glycoside hydrolase family 9 protein [Feifaniaceae bacterium]